MNIDKKIEEMRDDSKAQMIIKYAGTDSYSIREVLQNVDTHIDQLLQEKPTMTEAVELSKDKDYETKRLIREFYDEGYADAKEELSQLLQESNEEAVREFVERYLERVRTQTFVHKDMPNFMKQYLKEIKE